MLRNIFSFALVVMLVVLFAGNAQAQTTLVNASLTANATVTTALGITAPQTVEFGNVPTGKSAYISPTGTGHQYVGSGVKVGHLAITGANGAHIIVSWPTTITLTHAGDPSLTLTLAVNGDNLGTQGSPSDGGISPGANVITSGSGNYDLWVGGTMNTLAASDTFSGSGTFTVEYQ